jgi:diphthamide synthase (EF-2-diphthine--ammonia ligase)
MLKRLDSREQATRFERLAHPLGTITVTPLYSLALAASSLAAYKARLDKTGEVQMAS